MGNYTIMGCPGCGGNKSHSTHTYGTYRAYEFDTMVKLICKTCGFVIRYRTIRGGVTKNED